MKVPQIAVAAVLSAVAGPRLAEGHGYVTSPRSRNQLARPVDDGGDGAYAIDPTGNIVDEYCPHCLNRKDVDGVCGKKGQNNHNNYDDWVDANADPLEFMPQGIYIEEEVIVVNTTLATYHKGHMELRACNETTPTQACFDDYPLTFVEDLSENGDAPALADDDYPERAYYGPVPGSAAEDRFYSFKYSLPPGITGNVTLQYQYVTANYCNEEGYAAYFGNLSTAYPSADYESWWEPNLQTCTAIHPEGKNRNCGKGQDDRVCGERFWNCIEIEIL